MTSELETIARAIHAKSQAPDAQLLKPPVPSFARRWRRWETTMISDLQRAELKRRIERYRIFAELAALDTGSANDTDPMRRAHAELLRYIDDEL